MNDTLTDFDGFMLSIVVHFSFIGVRSLSFFQHECKTYTCKMVFKDVDIYVMIFSVQT